MNCSSLPSIGNTDHLLALSGFSISIVEYGSHVNRDWHYHEEPQLLLGLKGGSREVRKHKEVNIIPGSVTAYHPEEYHRNLAVQSGTKNMLVWFDEDFFVDNRKFTHFGNDSYASFCLIKLFHEYYLQDNTSPEQIELLATSLFQEEKVSSSSGLVDQIKGIIKERWSEFVTLEELALEIEVHPVTVSKVFAKATGTTIADYMRVIKVRRAIDLLLNTKKPVSSIAYECGFSDHSHMTRLFQNYLGILPKALRVISD